MDKRERLISMEEMILSVEQVIKNQTSLSEKIALMEAEKRYDGNPLREKQLSDIHATSQRALATGYRLLKEYTEERDKLIKETQLDELPPEIQ